MAGAAYGFADMGPYQGGQAEYLRVPWADFNCLRLPRDAEEKQNDYVMLADIFPTGWHATELAGVQPGETVVIYGGGPVGLMAAYSAMIKGACKVMVVDRHPDRLRLAEKIGAMPIDDSKGSPVEQVLELTNGLGRRPRLRVRRLPGARPAAATSSRTTMNNLVARCASPAASASSACSSRRTRARPTSWQAGQDRLRLRHVLVPRASGWAPASANVKRYNRQLRNLIHAGQGQPSFIVSHHLPLDEAPEAYEHFDRRDDGWTKVLLKPGANAGGAHNSAAG